MKRYFDLGNGFAELEAEFPDMKNFQIARIGDHEKRIMADDVCLYARMPNGSVIEAVNDNDVPPVYDLLVIVAEGKSLFGKMHILKVYECENGRIDETKTS